MTGNVESSRRFTVDDLTLLVADDHAIGEADAQATADREAGRA